MNLLHMLWLVLLLFLNGPEVLSEELSEVKLSLNEFEELFSAARLEQAERRILEQRKMHEAEHRRKLAELDDQLKQTEMKAEQRRLEMFPDNYQVLRYTASGLFNASSGEAGVEHDIASFKHEMTLRIMNSQWTEIPIADMDSTVASDWAVAWGGGEDGGENEFRDVDHVIAPDLMFVLRGTQQVLATNRSGLFKVQFKSFNRVARNRNLSQISMSNLKYPLSDFSLRIASIGDARTIREFNVQPSAAVLKVEPSDEYTTVNATLPLTTDSIEIRWLDAQDGSRDGDKSESDGVAAPDESSDSQQITAVSEALHSIGEGIISSTYVVEFSGTSETSSLGAVQFVLHGKRLRITSVQGHALQHWEADETKNTSKLVRASFKSSHMDSAATLIINTEMASEDLVELPRIECDGVIRQVGHVAVIKDANVEVHEHRRSGLTPCEPTEVSSKLRLNLDRSILLSYKFLDPENKIVLSVKEHVAMASETLEATIDRAHYKAAVTETHTMHSLILILQSTKLQYLEVLGLPSSASMFTLVVNSVPTKPVKGEDDENSILVPLLIGLDSQAANEGSSIRTSVELSYISEHDELGENGTFNLPPPRFTLPTSVLTTHLRLPKPYNYTFAGNMSGPSDRLAYPIPSSFSYKTGKRVVEEDYQFSTVDDMWAEEESQQAVVSPVKMVTPGIAGSSFYFHRIMVVGSAPALSVLYSQPEQVPTRWSRLSNMWKAR